MGIRNFLGSALAAFGLTTAASAIAQNEPVQQVTGAISARANIAIDPTAKLGSNTAILLAQNGGDVRLGNTTTQGNNAQLVSLLNLNGSFDGGIMGVKGVYSDTFGGGGALNLTLGGKRAAIGAVIEILEHARTALVSGAFNTGDMTFAGSYSKGKQGAKQYYKNPEFSGVQVDGNKVSFSITGHQLGILQNAGFQIDRAKTSPVELSRKSTHRIELSQNELDTYLQRISSDYIDTLIKTHSGGSDLRQSIVAEVPLSDTLLLKGDLGRRRYDANTGNGPSRNFVATLGGEYLPTPFWKLSGGTSWPSNIRSSSFAVSHILGNGGAEASFSVYRSGGINTITGGITIPLDGKILPPYAIRGGSSSSSAIEITNATLGDRSRRADPTSVGTMKSGTNSVLFSEESTYIPKATSTQVNNVVIAEDGTVTIDFGLPNGNALPLTSNIPSHGQTFRTSNAVPLAAQIPTVVLVEYCVVLGLPDGSTQRIAVTKSPAQFKLPDTVNGAFTIQVETKTTIGSTSTSALSPKMNQTRYKDAPSTIANLPNPTVTSTDATFSNIQLPTDPDGVRNIDFSIVTSSNNAKGTILSTGSILRFIGGTPGAQYVLAMTGETAKKKPDGSIEWIPFRKTSEFKLNVAAISPNASFAQPSVTKNFGDTAFASPTLTNPSGGAVTYSSGTPSVATVDQTTGQVTVAGVGSTTISALIAANGNYAAKTVTYTITVTLSTPPTTTFSINDITNKINFNGIDPSLYEISQNAGTTYATVTADSTFPGAQSVLIRKKATPTTTVSAAQTLSFTSSPLSISGSAFSQLQSFYNFDDNDVHTIFAGGVVDPEGGEIIYEMTGGPSPDSGYNSINSSTGELQLFYDAFGPTDFSVTITARTRSGNKSISKSFTIHFNDII